MKIVKAMKKVARLKGEIRELKKRMDSCLNSIVGNEFEEDLKELNMELHSKIKLMMELKVRIMHTNVANGMFSLVVNLGELKSYMDFLKELDPKIGVKSASRFSEELVEYKSQLTIKEKNDLIAKCQKHINEITDGLDDFNATTDLLEVKMGKFYLE